MDCSLLVFDFYQSPTLAAANNPVWIIRNKIILGFPVAVLNVLAIENRSILPHKMPVELQKGDTHLHPL